VVEFSKTVDGGRGGKAVGAERKKGKKAVPAFKGWGKGNSIQKGKEKKDKGTGSPKRGAKSSFLARKARRGEAAYSRGRHSEKRGAGAVLFTEGRNPKARGEPI